MTGPDVITVLVALGALFVSLRGNRRNDFDSLRDELRKQRDAFQADVIRLESRVTGLEASVSSLTRWRQIAVGYIHELVAALKAANRRVPQPPPELDLTIDAEIAANDEGGVS